MSKNFELLQRLSKKQEIFETGTELSAFPSLEVASSSFQDKNEETSTRPSLQKEPSNHLNELQPTKLEMEERQRGEIMKLVQNVFIMPVSDGPRIVVLASSEPGNGCSWICCRTAEILATHVKAPVCVVDANLRSPGLHQNFGVENHHGLSDALNATGSIRNFIRPLGRENLWLLSCGADAANSHNLIMSSAMLGRLAELRQYFEYILVDAPALSLGNEAMLLGRAADGIVLVLKANTSRRESARKAVQDLQSAGAKVLGAVLNQRTFPIPQVIYNKL